ncbi:hypothetical protein EDB81DRAFT_949960 [Dactylonectria macrodidyma]|uniref:DUF7932 domain-containing protein n=1 Tax=Dactylonectria macrodidyma TaxID=307937 RepID=A0A9P9IU98_9HYPO|nr:hypothetical protein EDB81DRAFT_949960 [Dactylonectria macrodidyma]
MILTAGQTGDPPVDDFNWGDRHVQANPGYGGFDGRSATNPTNGSPGSDIRVGLFYTPDEPAVVQIQGNGAHSGMAWKVSKDEKMLLNAKGGNGGDGGRGEDGQDGGRGRNGRNATQNHPAGNGGDGGHGGSGGFGTNGANGGGAGNVFVTVDENDTDLLVSLIIDVRGGVGGIAGEHGDAGRGGRGGKGGKGISWTDGNGNRQSYPAGSNGSSGRPGIKPSTHLNQGRAGPNGSVQIKVIRGDLTEATYPSVYSLQVVGFDIIDENQDGINEPGEHITVHNIRVKNVGGMPSPSASTVQLLIQETSWLTPIATEPLWLPQSIQPDQQVEIPGTLRAYIQNRVGRPVLEKLEVTEDVRLIAIFNERMQRALPDFCDPSHITITYPLILSPPTYLDCVAKGDNVRFKWVLHNNSTKSYGINGTLKRAAATKLKDPNRFFDLTYASGDNPDEATDEILELEANSMVEIEQDFAVDPNTMEFVDGLLTLELTLADPISGAIRRVQTHEMQIQISSRYSLSANPSYLLVVNAKTPNYAIHQIIFLIRSRLQTHLDIFNISLTGSFVSPATNESVIKSYVGKNVIIFGNKFPWFGLAQPDVGESVQPDVEDSSQLDAEESHSDAGESTQSDAEESAEPDVGESADPDTGESTHMSVNLWDLLDPQETGILCKGGTNVLFANVDDMLSLNDWATQGTFPEHEFSTTAESITDKDAGRAIDALRQTALSGLPAKTQAHRFRVKKGIFRSINSQANVAAKSAAKHLNKKLPLRRFVVIPDRSTISQEAGTGTVVIIEGIPKTATLLASEGFYPQTSPPGLTISDYDMFMIVSIFPFAVRARMFWNFVGRSDATGLACDALYEGIERWWNREDSKIDDKVLQTLSLSLQYDIATEIYRFCATRPRFPDPLSSPEKLAQLHLFSEFFAMAPAVASGQVTDVGRAQLLTQTLGAVHAMSNSLSRWQSVKSAFRFLGNRKGRLSPKLNEAIQSSIAATCSPDVAAAIREHVQQQSKKVKDVIVGAKDTFGHKNFEGVLHQEVAKFVDVDEVGFHDLTDLNQLSIALYGRALKVHRDQSHLHRQNQENFSKHAKGVLHALVNPADDA